MEPNTMTQLILKTVATWLVPHDITVQRAAAAPGLVVRPTGCENGWVAKRQDDAHAVFQRCGSSPIPRILILCFRHAIDAEWVPLRPTRDRLKLPVDQ